MALRERLSKLYLNETGADVHFIIDEERIPAHTILLSAASSVFYSMFYGVMERKSEIEITDIGMAEFKALLRYIYTDEIDVDDRSIFGLLYASSKYMIDNVRSSILIYIATSADVRLALQAIIHQPLIPENILRTCWLIIDERGGELLRSDLFTSIEHGLLVQLISRDTFLAKETEILNGVAAWATAECQRQSIEINRENMRKVLGNEVLHELRIPTMSAMEFALCESARHLLNDDEIINCFCCIVGAQPKVELKFNTRVRSPLQPKHYIVSRFDARNDGGYWFCLRSYKNSFYFMADRSINLHSVALYGPKSGCESEFEVEVEVRKNDAPVYTTHERKHTHEQIFWVEFGAVIKIQPMCMYEITAIVVGENTFYGVGGKEVVRVSTSSGMPVKFWFFPSENSTCQDLTVGQVPCLRFSLT